MGRVENTRESSLVKGDETVDIQKSETRFFDELVSGPYVGQTDVNARPSSALSIGRSSK